MSENLKTYLKKFKVEKQKEKEDTKKIDEERTKQREVFDSAFEEKIKVINWTLHEEEKDLMGSGLQFYNERKEVNKVVCKLSNNKIVGYLIFTGNSNSQKVVIDSFKTISTGTYPIIADKEFAVDKITPALIQDLFLQVVKELTS